MWSAIAARNSANMIGKLNRALTVEIVFVAAFIGLAFRSLVAMFASILPGIFPILVSGTVLWFMAMSILLPVNMIGPGASVTRSDLTLDTLKRLS